MAPILYAVGAFLIVIWLVGFIISFLFRYVINPLIHLLLVIGLIVLAYQYLTRKREV